MSARSAVPTGDRTAAAGAGTNAKPIDARTPLEDFIVFVPDALPAAYCDALLAEYGPSADWNATRLASGTVQRNVRNADTILLSNPGVIERNRVVRRALDAELMRHTAALLKHYLARFPHFRITRDTGFEMLRYLPGGFYRQHTDSFHDIQRALACSYLLNDDFAGGAFAFFDRSRTVEMRKGDALLFPANFMYPHEVLPVTEGVRHSVVTWFI